MTLLYRYELNRSHFMNNSNNSKLDSNGKLPMNNTIESNINSRSLNIYEQYLKKTIYNINYEMNKPLTNDDASLEEGSANLSSSDSHKMVATSNKILVADKNLKNGSMVLMIIGGFCVLLLIALVVIQLNATDDLVNRLGSVDSQIVEVSDNLSVIGKENSLATAQAIADEKLANAETAKSLALVRSSLNTIVINAELEKTKSEPVLNTRRSSMQLVSVDAEPEQISIDSKEDSGISYNSFKKESENVLYRDSSY